MTESMSSDRRARGLAFFRCVLWVLSLLLILWLLQSALGTSRLPLSLRFVVAAVAAIAAVAPGPALVAVAFLAPIGYALVTLVWNAYPFALPEALVLAFFAGYLWSQREAFVGATRSVDPVSLPSMLFSVVVLGSCVVQATILQTWREYPLPYLMDLARYLRTDYMTALTDPRAWLDGRGFLSVAALLLESIALMRCCRRLCTEQRRLARSVAAALVASGVLAAAIGLLEPIAMARESHESLWHVLMSQRWSTPALPSLNTAGPFYMLLGALGVAGAAANGAFAWLWLLGAGIAFGAMWLTQTRSAIVASLAVVAAMGAWTFSRRFRRGPSPWIAVSTVVVAAAVGIVLVFLNPGHILAEGINRSLRFRVLFAEVGLRMLSSAPLTGVGVGQFEIRYADFASPELLRIDPRPNNAHNYFLWMAAELGLPGVGLFIWLLVATIAESWRNLRAAPDWPKQIRLAGLTAFIVTWSIGQPLVIPQAAFAFWLTLGLATAPEAGARVPAANRRTPLWFGPVALTAVLLTVAVSIPWRIQWGVGDIDLSRVRYGFHNAGNSPDQGPFTWAGPALTFHLRASVGVIEVPLAALLPSMPNGARVRIRIDSREAGTEWLAPGQWRTIRLSPPSPPVTGYWRVEMQVDPIGLRSGIPDSDLRIAVGEIRKLPLPASPASD